MKPEFFSDLKSPRHLLSAADLSESEIRFYLSVARIFETAVQQGESLPFLKNSTVVQLFFENSTRTRTSFDLATRKLGGSSLHFSATTSSLQKGETLIDTAMNIQAMRPQCLIVRHSSAGSPQTLAKLLKIPIVNAGDGFHEHPTQGLLDAFTIESKLGSVKNKRILIIGDIAHSRVARSNIHILKKLGAKVSVCGPPTLIPPFPETLGVEYSYRAEDLLPETDVVMALRIQLERQNKMQIPSLGEYSRHWGLNRERAQLLKRDAIILHPGPLNRGVEIDPEVADGPHSVILDQVFNGVLVRMAVLAGICQSNELSHWLEKRGYRV